MMSTTKTGIDGKTDIVCSISVDVANLSRCEYIFYRGLYRTAYARVSRGIVTDTELQIARFVLPRHGFGVTNETVEARTLRSFKEELPEDHVRMKKPLLWNNPD